MNSEKVGTWAVLQGKSQLIYEDSWLQSPQARPWQDDEQHPEWLGWRCSTVYESRFALIGLLFFGADRPNLPDHPKMLTKRSAA